MKRKANPKSILPGLVRLLRAFRPQIRRQRSLLLLAFVSVSAGILFQVLEPWPVKFIYDHIFLRSGHHLRSMPFHLNLAGVDTRLLLTILALSLVLVAGLGALADYFSTVLLTLAASRVLAEVRANLFFHLANLPLSFHTRNKSGDLITRITYDIDRMREVTVTAALPLFTNGLAFFAMLGVMLWMNWRLALVAVVASPIFVFSVTRITRRIKETASKQRSREGRVAATTAEAIGAIKTVQALSLQHAFAGIFAVNNTRSLQEGARAQQLSAGLERTIEVMVASTTAVVLWGGAQLAIDKAITPGDLIVFVNYMRTAFKPMRQLAKSLGQIARATASGDRILELMQTVPMIRDCENAVGLPTLEGDIRFENVSFSYEPGRLALDHVNLEVRPGQRVAVVGPSGGGKSTMANLLQRFYDPDAGRVLVDGHDIRTCKLETLRSQTSIVLQDSVLFAVSARENIRLGAAGASEADVLAAARFANAHEFLMRLPQGYDTVLGERGATLSGGQRQRIAIARAALRKAPIVILDEPATGLDGQNESEVMAALDRLSAGRTTLLISHDLKAAKQADLIVYLAKGRVVERGTHQELMALGGEYAATYMLQTAPDSAPDKEDYYAVET
jgi:ATP-binding cassette subfamily B protein